MLTSHQSARMGNSREPKNYKLINLTCIVCKVKKKIIKNNTMEHLADCSVRDKQYAYSRMDSKKEIVHCIFVTFS